MGIFTDNVHCSNPLQLHSIQTDHVYTQQGLDNVQAQADVANDIPATEGWNWNRVLDQVVRKCDASCLRGEGKCSGMRSNLL